MKLQNPHTYDPYHKLLSKNKQDELFNKLDKLYPNRLAGKMCIPENCQLIVSEIASHLWRLVYSTAQKNIGKMGRLEFDDLVQAGQEGLIKGIWKFDNSTGNRLTTYVVYWIRQSIDRLIDGHAHGVYTPVHIGMMRRKISAVFGHQIPSIQEVAELLGVSEKKAEEILMANNILIPTSLDKEMGGGDEDLSLHNIVPDRSVDFDDIVNEQFLVDALDNLMHTLDWREEKIIRLRFACEDITLEEVGAKFGFTRERARQIEKEALGKLRRHIGVEKLRAFL